MTVAGERRTPGWWERIRVRTRQTIGGRQAEGNQPGRHPVQLARQGLLAENEQPGSVQRVHTMNEIKQQKQKQKNTDQMTE